MRFPVKIRPEALDDLLTARDWYDARRPGFGTKLLDAFDHAVERISNTPEGYERVVGVVRRIVLPQFPYVVYFRDQTNAVEVIAVLHGRQDDRTWRDRV